MTSVWLPATTKHPIGVIDHGAKPRTEGVVLHIAQGSFDGTVSWFENPNRPELTGAHVLVGDTKVWQFAALDRKVWHAGAANDHLVGFEHSGTTKRTHEQWMVEHHSELVRSANRASWILHEYNLGRPKYGKNIFKHSDGGAAWGGHPCPGENFPLPEWVDLCMDAYLGHWGRK